MIKYYKFRYSDFFENEGGLYLRGVWTAPRLEPLDRFFFLPKRNAVYKWEDDEFYITSGAWQWFLDQLRADFRYDIVGGVPEPLSEGWTQKEEWEEFVDMYPFTQSGKLTEQSWRY